MKTAFLVNPSARWKPHLKSLISEIENRFLGEKEIFSWTALSPTPRKTRTHCAREFTEIVVAGGDGTLNRTINFLKNRISRTSFRWASSRSVRAMILRGFSV